MGITFNADEIFEIAVRIEANGANFYRHAAEKMSDARTKKILLDLAEMEDEHKMIFSSMRAELSQQEKKTISFDPEGQTVAYLKAMADGRVFDINVDPKKYLSINQTPESILKTAIGFEKDSIAFYIGMLDMVPEKLGRARIDGIIKEEMSHITILNEELTRFAL